MGRDFKVFNKEFYKDGKRVPIEVALKGEYGKDYDEEEENETTFPIRVSRHNSHINIWEESYFSDPKEITEKIEELLGYLKNSYAHDLSKLTDKEVAKLVVEDRNYSIDYWNLELSDKEKEDEIKVFKEENEKNLEEDKIVNQDIREAIAVYSLIGNMLPIWVRYS
jgi:hypothetical protein